MKQENETALDAALDRYFEHFGLCYPFCMGVSNGTDAEIIERIDECIRTDTPYEPHPEYKDGCLY